MACNRMWSHVAVVGLLLLLHLAVHGDSILVEPPPPSFADKVAPLSELLLAYADVLDPVGDPADADRRDRLLPKLRIASVNAEPGATGQAIVALHLAHQRVLKDMLAKDKRGSFSLRDAADRSAAWALVPLLLLLSERNASLDLPGPLGYTPLQHATAYMEHQAMEVLLTSGADPSVAVDAKRLSPLHLAVRNCDTEGISLLLQHYADPEASDLYGRKAGDLLGSSALWCSDVPTLLLPTTGSEAPPSADWDALPGDPAGMGDGWRPLAVDTTTDILPCRVILPSVTVTEGLGLDWFLKDVVSAGRPLVFLNATYGWPLVRTFRRSVLLQAYGQVDMMVSAIPYGDIFGVRSGVASVEEYISYMDLVAAAPPEYAEPLYVFDHAFLQRHVAGQYPLPAAVMQLWGALDQAHQFFLGPTQSGAPFHLHEPAVNALLYGQKQWWLTPPGRARYESRHPTRPFRPAVEHSISCLQQPGELIYIPRLWGHSTLNKAESIGIAVEFDTTSCYDLVQCPNWSI